MTEQPLLLPHHDGSPLYVSTQTPALGDTIMVRVRVPHSFGKLTAVRTRSNPNHEPLFTDAKLIATGDGWDWWEAPIEVANPRHGYRFMLLTRTRDVFWLNASGIHTIETLDAEDFAVVTSAPAPEWMNDAVMYQIFPDRFARSAAADAHATPEWAIPAKWNDPVNPVMPDRSQQFYGGDLDGITEHLDHLEALGVNLVYLTPVFPAASNHRYDASNFTEVDPLLGGDEAYKRLIDAIHARGMRIIGDLTSNHSGDRHEWFRAAYGKPGAPESDFYYFENPEQTKYVSWLGYETLPKFNWASAELRRRFIEGPDSVVGRWLQPPYAIDGWRIDVANMTGRLGDIDLNTEVREMILRTMREINPDTILLGESTNDATSDLQGDAWHGAMTYPSFTRPLWGWLSDPQGTPYLDANGDEQTEPWFFTQPIGGIPRYTARDVVAAMTSFTAGIPWRIRLGNMLPLDTHDTARFATNAAPGTVDVAVGLEMTLPGIPVIFAGDEFGLTGADGESSRTPMPWGTEADPLPRERIALYSDLVQLRRSHESLRTGGLRFVHVDDDTIVFVREMADESMLVLASRASVDLVLAPHAVVGASDAESVHGDVTFGVADDDAVVLVSDGPVFAVWALPGANVELA